MPVPVSLTHTVSRFVLPFLGTSVFPKCESVPSLINLPEGFVLIATVSLALSVDGWVCHTGALSTGCCSACACLACTIFTCCCLVCIYLYCILVSSFFL